MLLLGDAGDSLTFVFVRPASTLTGKQKGVTPEDLVVIGRTKGFMSYLARVRRAALLLPSPFLSSPLKGGQMWHYEFQNIDNLTIDLVHLFMEKVRTALVPISTFLSSFLSFHNCRFLQSEEAT